jgi:hypothetical protein
MNFRDLNAKSDAQNRADAANKATAEINAERKPDTTNIRNAQNLVGGKEFNKQVRAAMRDLAKTGQTPKDVRETQALVAKDILTPQAEKKQEVKPAEVFDSVQTKPREEQPFDKKPPEKIEPLAPRTNIKENNTELRAPELPSIVHANPPTGGSGVRDDSSWYYVAINGRLHFQNFYVFGDPKPVKI